METVPAQADLYQCPVVESRTVGAYHLIAFVAGEIAAVARPGQFVMIRQSGPALDPLLPRPMGIHAVEADLVKVLVEPVGKGTVVLTDARVGDRYSVLGPLGNGFDLSGEGTAVIVGGGVGMAPLALLAGTLAGRGRDVRCQLGFKTRVQAVAAELFRDVDVDICTEDGTMGRKAMVSELLVECLTDLGPAAAEAELFVCGPGAMMRAAVETAREYGADAQVSVAAHMACGVGACQGCVVRAGGEYRCACNQGPVFRAGELEWR